MNQYRFIDVQKATFTTRALCRALCVPESSYYDWDRHGRRIADDRAARDAGLVEQIRRVHDETTGTYGSPRITEELNDDGVVVSERKVAELMAANGIAGISGREHSTVTTRADRMKAPFPDLLQRNFQPERPDTAWYGDVTYIWVGGRFWYLAILWNLICQGFLACRVGSRRTFGIWVAVTVLPSIRGVVPAGLGTSLRRSTSVLRAA